METTQSSPLEQALAAEVRALAARMALSHKEIQDQSGISQRSFRRYFVECSRPIPMDAVFSVAAVLGVSASELMATAESASMPEPAVRRPSVRRSRATEHQPQPDE